MAQLSNNIDGAAGWMCRVLLEPLIGEEEAEFSYPEEREQRPTVGHTSGEQACTVDMV